MMDFSRKWDLVYHLMCAEAAALDLEEREIEEHLQAVRRYYQRKEAHRRVQGKERAQ